MRMPLQDLCLINAELRGEPELGLRAERVYCVSRDRRVIHFAEPGDIPEALARCLRDWERRVDEADGPMETAAACARFWMTFIAIHPFPDKNGATGREFLRRELGRRGIRIASFHWLDRYLITGEVEKDLRALACVFALTLDLGSPGLAPKEAFA